MKLLGAEKVFSAHGRGFQVTATPSWGLGRGIQLAELDKCLRLVVHRSYRHSATSKLGVSIIKSALVRLAHCGRHLDSLNVGVKSLAVAIVLAGIEALSWYLNTRFWLIIMIAQRIWYFERSVLVCFIFVI